MAPASGAARSLRALVTLVAGCLLLTACTPVSAKQPLATPSYAIHKIKHVVIVMQENRSFDSYFGTFPGADGIPMHLGIATVCVPDPTHGGCVRPYHDPNDVNHGGPHGADAATVDIGDGRMDGFVKEAEQNQERTCTRQYDPNCSDAPQTDVMGYHDAREIPNYWAYAKRFVLQDHMFEPAASWSIAAHLYAVSEWSAACATPGDPASCRSDVANPPHVDLPRSTTPAQVPRPDYAWTDLTWLLHDHHVSWRYYVAEGTQPDCYDDDAVTCDAPVQKVGTPEIWNPLPYFDTVHADGQVGNIQAVPNFFDAARSGTLPAVSWVVPNGRTSEWRCWTSPGIPSPH